ncbi:hypothetical protein ACRE_063360 [Hapsidospora chrysogenum ATCC 11550]|uniref:Uncharacterized protein n=1 Tax=Hapsidospora chrysogenum (strain ATCC 11550 / CBS 779.69 / DSM 880 / IAM 14645 / JCM 23072 / IMI 49137) TaxID=857340 RepID=A0A086T0S6_HAPC1|nr:hypothetical protein ACRE_063360 [Hapsidospora chrysogenum ATCC 11550]
MLCGSKWKSCDCEWFNFDEDDDLDGYYAERGNPFLSQGREDDPADADLPEPPAHGHARMRATGEGRYRRRLQEHRDEELARRLQYGMELDSKLSVDDDDDVGDYDDYDDYDDSYVVGGSCAGAATGLGISSGPNMDEHYRHSSGRNRARVRVKPSSATGVYDRRAGYRTPPRDICDRASHGPEASQARGARGGSMERRLAERLSEGRKQRFSPMPDMVMGYPPQSMNAHMGVVPPVLPPPPMGTYPPTRMPMGMAAAAGSPPMMASPQHHPFGGGLPSHGPPPMHHAPPMLMGEYAPMPGGGGAIRRRDSGGSAPRSSSMAGLNAQGSGLSRVFEWRNFVPPGVPDSDGPRTSDERLSRVTWDG